jgi:uncharacterized DUF497 family protein
MIFEFDSAKSENNKRKYGISFLEAHELWDDPDYILIPFDAPVRATLN